MAWAFCGTPLESRIVGRILQGLDFILASGQVRSEVFVGPRKDLDLAVGGGVVVNGLQHMYDWPYAKAGGVASLTPARSRVSSVVSSRGQV